MSRASLFSLPVFGPRSTRTNSSRRLSGPSGVSATGSRPTTSKDPQAGIKKLTAAEAVIAGQSADLLFDQRDLLAHGEQFINGTLASQPYAYPNRPPRLTPAAGKQPEDLRGEYAIAADVDGLFVGATPALRLCYYEGITNLNIAGHIVDFTAGR